MTDLKNLSELSQKELIRMEREIAAKHVGRKPWLAITWSISNFVIWLSLWPLVLTGTIPLWLGFVIATANMALSYLPSHEAQHDIIARPGEKLRWLNELIGWIGSIPLVMPYPALKATHMEHHKNANDPKLDPDYFTHASGPLRALWRFVQAMQPRGKNTQASRYEETLQRLGRKDLIIQSAIMTLAFYSFLFTMAWFGYAIEAALLWWLPRHLGFAYIIFFLAWSPHHGTSKGRYRDTRAWRSQLGNIGSMGMQFHIIHHLHPRIPLYRTPQAYWEMRPILKARGCDLGEM